MNSTLNDGWKKKINVSKTVSFLYTCLATVRHANSPPHIHIATTQVMVLKLKKKKKALKNLKMH